MHYKSLVLTVFKSQFLAWGVYYIAGNDHTHCKILFYTELDNRTQARTLMKAHI